MGDRIRQIQRGLINSNVAHDNLNAQLTSLNASIGRPTITNIMDELQTNKSELNPTITPSMIRVYNTLGDPQLLNTWIEDVNTLNATTDTVVSNNVLATLITFNDPITTFSQPVKTPQIRFSENTNEIQNYAYNHNELTTLLNDTTEFTTNCGSLNGHYTSIADTKEIIDVSITNVQSTLAGVNVNSKQTRINEFDISFTDATGRLNTTTNLYNNMDSKKIQLDASISTLDNSYTNIQSQYITISGDTIDHSSQINTTDISTIQHNGTIQHLTVRDNWLQLGPVVTSTLDTSFTEVLAVVDENVYRGIAVSATGQYVSTICRNSGTIYRSYTYGNTWSEISVNKLTNIAMSADGKYQLGTSYGGANANNVISSDYGITFANITHATVSDVYAFVCFVSDTGQYMTMGSDTAIYYSHDYGVQWGVSTISLSYHIHLVGSGTGKYQLVTDIKYGSKQYISIDYGVTWAQTTNTPYGRYCASSMLGDFLYIISVNTIYISTDYGANWASTLSSPSFVANEGMRGISCFYNGQYVIVNTNIGNIYTSTNYGATWIQSISGIYTIYGYTSENVVDADHKTDYRVDIRTTDMGEYTFIAGKAIGPVLRSTLSGRISAASIDTSCNTILQNIGTQRAYITNVYDGSFGELTSQIAEQVNNVNIADAAINMLGIEVTDASNRIFSVDTSFIKIHQDIVDLDTSINNISFDPIALTISAVVHRDTITAIDQSLQIMYNAPADSTYIEAPLHVHSNTAAVSETVQMDITTTANGGTNYTTSFLAANESTPYVVSGVYTDASRAQCIVSNTSDYGMRVITDHTDTTSSDIWTDLSLDSFSTDVSATTLQNINTRSMVLSGVNTPLITTTYANNTYTLDYATSNRFFTSDVTVADFSVNIINFPSVGSLVDDVELYYTLGTATRAANIHVTDDKSTELYSGTLVHSSDLSVNPIAQLYKQTFTIESPFSYVVSSVTNYVLMSHFNWDVELTMGSATTTITASGEYMIYVFTEDQLIAFSRTFRGCLLLVGGGGGGGTEGGGGGGGGAVIYDENVQFGANNIDISIGAGGDGAKAFDGITRKDDSNYRGKIGGNTTITNVTGGGNYTANGGGYGGTWAYAAGDSVSTDGTTQGGGGGQPTNGGFAGSLNGGSRSINSVDRLAGGGGSISNQAITPLSGYGAGGYGADGYKISGVGTFGTIIANKTYSHWGGGGGGCGYKSVGVQNTDSYNTRGGNGGNGGGGGGDGGRHTNEDYRGYSGDGYMSDRSQDISHRAGRPNTGGGGGGGTIEGATSDQLYHIYESNNNGGNGGSGIVIIMVPYM